MFLIVVSHKEIWPDTTSPTGFGTIGGFPFQMQVLSELFDRTLLILPVRNHGSLGGNKPLTGNNLNIIPFPEPTGSNLRRKLVLLTWLPLHFTAIWQQISRADAVHAPVPGDIGFIGLILALLQRKPLFVRHCGTWGEPVTHADKVLHWLLEKIAGGRNVVLATGGANTPPSKINPNIAWIFSTTLSQAELENMPLAESWSSEKNLRLITVCRLTEGKNVQAILHALPMIHERFPGAQLDILGEGEYRPTLEQLAKELGLTEFVTFHGNVSHSEVINTLSQSHVFVFPTQVKEGFPKALLEALACGLPVVATKVSVIPQLIEGCGEVLDIPHPEAVAHGVCSILENANDLVNMSAQARKRAALYTLEGWRDTIGKHLEAAWGPLRTHTS